MKKILMAASSGGHLEEILALKQLKEQYETVLVTEKTEYEVRFWQDKVYLFPQMNRREWKGVLDFFKCFPAAAKILREENPDAVLSTGAMMSFPFLLMAKLQKRKTIFIECLFNVDAPTLTGKLAYSFVDLFLVQWPEMLKVYPKAVLGGRVF